MTLKDYLKENNLLTDELETVINKYYELKNQEKDKDIILNFGKYKSNYLMNVIKQDPKYCEWVYNTETFNNQKIKNIIKKELRL